MVLKIMILRVNHTHGVFYMRVLDIDMDFFMDIVAGGKKKGLV